MAGGWRVTARMVATAVAAKAVTRAAESVRKLLDEAAPQAELAAAPAAPELYPPVAHLTATAGLHPAPSSEDRVIAAQVVPPHEFGPIPLVAPSHGIGFRSEPRRREPAGEMPVISRPPSEEPGGRKDVAPAAPVIMPKSVTTAAAFVQDLDDTDDDASRRSTHRTRPPQEPGRRGRARCRGRGRGVAEPLRTGLTSRWWSPSPKSRSRNQSLSRNPYARCG